MNINETKYIESLETDPAAGSAETSRRFSWYHPQSFWDVAGVHLPLALVTGIPLLMSFLLPLNLLPLLPCTVLQLSGYPCPFCGFTRSFWAISAGDWTYALWNAPLAVPVYLIFVAVFVFNATALFGCIRIKRGNAWRLSSRQTRCLVAFIAVLFLINWIYRLSLGLK